MDYISQLEDAFAGHFMQPEAFLGSEIDSRVIEAGLDLEYDGVYARLSAPGYLDCTEWEGPFETAQDAARHLIETYAYPISDDQID